MLNKEQIKKVKDEIKKPSKFKIGEIVYKLGEGFERFKICDIKKEFKDINFVTHTYYLIEENNIRNYQGRIIKASEKQLFADRNDLELHSKILEENSESLDLLENMFRDESNRNEEFANKSAELFDLLVKHTNENFLILQSHRFHIILLEITFISLVTALIIGHLPLI